MLILDSAPLPQKKDTHRHTHTHTHAPKRSEIENKYKIIINKIILFPGCIPDHTPAALVNTEW